MRTIPILLGLAAIGFAAGVMYGGQVVGALMPDAGSHGAWYASRAAGFASYFFLWVALAGGVLMSSAWFDGLVNRGRLLAIHQAAAISGLALGLGHALVLIPDGWTGFGLVDLFVPFASSYHRALTGIGTTSLYLFAIVTFSFWVRGAIGIRLWRWIHYASAVAFAGALWHGIQLGSDTQTPWARALYLGTTAVLLGAIILRTTYLKPIRKPGGRTVRLEQP